jgi:hypothetical protein
VLQDTLAHFESEYVFLIISYVFCPKKIGEQKGGTGSAWKLGEG